MITEKTRQKILNNFMKSVEESGWSGVDMVQLAKKSGIKSSTMRDSYPSKVRLLEDFAAMIDQTVLNNFELDADSNPKDRLFDVLMARLDALTPYRSALKRLNRNMCSDPEFALTCNRISLRSMRWMLNCSQIEVRGLKGAAKVQGLVVLFGRVMRIWFDDEEKGLSRTMAALDRGIQRGSRALCQLDRVEQMVCNFGRIICEFRNRDDRSDNTGPASSQA